VAALAALLAPAAVAGAQEAAEPVVIGQAVRVTSRVLGEERPLLVYLPPGYASSPGARYPVLYLLDAETHFHHTTGLVGYLAREGLAPQTIVVGVVNTDRRRDFTPSARADAPGSGGAAGMLAFLRDELVPWVDARYRTVPFRILFGHSATGNFGLWTLTEAPGLFPAVVAASPWVIWDDAYTLRHSRERWREGRPPAGFLYLTAGDEPDLVPDLERYRRLLRDRAPETLTWSYRAMPAEDHGSLVPATLQDGLRALYAGWRPPAEVGSLAALRRHYAALSARFGYPIPPPEQAVNLLGYRRLQAGDAAAAVAAFTANVEAWPQSANVYDSLGEGLEAAGRLAAAVRQYELAVERGEANGDPLTTAFRAHLEAARRRLAETP
jgi:predicted alpha/beta superfamily hydrolase